MEKGLIMSGVIRVPPYVFTACKGITVGLVMQAIWRDCDDTG